MINPLQATPIGTAAREDFKKNQRAENRSKKAAAYCLSRIRDPVSGL